jgi:hypothetical protein
VDHTNTGELAAPTNGDHVSTVNHSNTGQLTVPTNGDHVSTMDHTNTGELTAPTRTEQLHYQNQQKIVKEEYIYDNFVF